MTSAVVPKSDPYGQSIIAVLANKQDITGAVDELDLVDNLDVEHAANTMKCPTRVEICSCNWGENQSKDNTIGIKNGYKWLLDIIVKNYSVLNNRLKDSQNNQNERATEMQVSRSDTSSRLSIHSNPFKPIKEVVSKKEEIQATVSQNGVIAGKKLKTVFMHKNKTAPLTSEESVIEIGNVPESAKSTTVILRPQQSLQAFPSILNPVALNAYSDAVKSKPNRPYTAPERSQHFVNKITVINIPGQVMRE